MIGQGRGGLWIASICAAVVLTSVGYGMGRRAALKSLGSTVGVTPAGAPLPTIQIEPVQPQEELAAINSAEALPATAGAAVGEVSSLAPAALSTAADAASSAGSLPAEESARVREIQLALKAAGFDPGTADGRLGPRTKTAIHDFQLANGLQADGKVGPRTWSKLETYLETSNQTATAASTD